MAITAYTGLPGSGKSYNVVENVIIPALKQGREVHTNIPVFNDKLEKDFGGSVQQFDINDILDNPSWFDELPNGIVLVIDEVWKLWKSGESSSDALDSHLHFLREHRHLVNQDNVSTQVIVATQDLADCAAYLRRLVASTYRHVKLDDLGLDNRFRIDIYSGAATGQNPSKEKPPINQVNNCKYKPEVYQYYQSHTKTESDEIGAYENRMDDRNNVWKDPNLYIKVIGALVAVVLSVLAVINILLGDEDAEAQPEPVAITNQVQPVQQTRQQTLVPLFRNKTVSIKYNSGVLPRINYVFDIKGSGQSATLTSDDLRRLGFQVKAISNCMAYIGKDAFEIYPMCQEEQTPQGIINEITQTTSL